MTEEHGIAAGLGGLDLNSLLSAAQDMQTQMVESQRALAETVVEGQSGGGAVTIAVTGGLEFRSVSIADEVVDPVVQWNPRPESRRAVDVEPPEVVVEEVLRSYQAERLAHGHEAHGAATVAVDDIDPECLRETAVLDHLLHVPRRPTAQDVHIHVAGQVLTQRAVVAGRAEGHVDLRSVQ